MYNPLIELVSSIVGLGFFRNQISLLAQFDSTFRKRQTDHKRKCQRGMYAGMFHELNHLLPFKTLTGRSDLFGWVSGGGGGLSGASVLGGGLLLKSNS